MKLFLDCDGVLSDLDGYGLRVFGLYPSQVEDRYGTSYLYDLMHLSRDFYASLPLLPDAMELYRAVAHLRPVILTGRPCMHDYQWAVEQKLRWTAKRFPGVQTIVCPSTEKWQYMQAEGDVLVDDRLKYAHLWTLNGGRFILHTSAKDTILQLKGLGML